MTEETGFNHVSVQDLDIGDYVPGVYSVDINVEGGMFNFTATEDELRLLARELYDAVDRRDARKK